MDQLRLLGDCAPEAGDTGEGGRAEARKRRLENIDEITLQSKLNLDTFRLGHLEADQLNKPACGKEPLE